MYTANPLSSFCCTPSCGGMLTLIPVVVNVLSCDRKMNYLCSFYFSPNV
jgi:hypothetical protein